MSPRILVVDDESAIRLALRGLLRRDGHSQLVYKHAISTIMPGQPVHLMETDPAETQQQQQG